MAIQCNHKFMQGGVKNVKYQLPSTEHPKKDCPALRLRRAHDSTIFESACLN